MSLSLSLKKRNLECVKQRKKINRGGTNACHAIGGKSILPQQRTLLCEILQIMDGDRRAPAAAAASVAAVFCAGDLLREILLRLTFPHYLVRAALVSKQWLLHASDPAFLRRFRDRHPPSLLAFCAGYPRTAYQFVQLPQPPELAALSRRAASSCNEAFAARGSQWIKHCRNGHLLIERPHRGRGEYSLLAPLLNGEPIAILPPVGGCISQPHLLLLPLISHNLSCLSHLTRTHTW
nr:uncharacterized protein LOC127338849 [Lolium perenne]